MKRWNKRTCICALAACLVALSLLCGCGLIEALGGGLVPEGTTEADLRGKDLSAEQVAELSKSTQLTRLDIRENPVTTEQFDTLAAALPHCEILWSVPIGGQTFDSDTTQLTLPAVDAAELQKLRYLPNLTAVDATACDCYDALLAMQKSRPGCTFLWNVSIGGRQVPCTETALDLSGATVTAGELSAALPYLPALTGVDLHDTGLDGQALSMLLSAFPAIRFEANLDVCGKLFDLTATSLDLSGAGNFDAQALSAALAFFPDAETVDLSGLAVTGGEMQQLAAAYPEIVFVWETELAGAPVSTADTELDISGKSVDDLDAFTAALAALPSLKKLVMCDCGLTNEQMGALCEQFPDIKFVWYITVGRWRMRTDVTAFSTGQERNTEQVTIDKKGSTSPLKTEDIQPLKYCTDMIALDIGHQKIDDISVVANMKKLRFLIIADGKFTDISPIANCTELEFLEVFQNYIADFSPLLALKKLRLLNCGATKSPDAAAEETASSERLAVLEQMTQLERLWCIHGGFDKSQLAELQAALPDCVIQTTGVHSTSNGWRENDLYPEMQKLFGLQVLD